LARKRAEEAGAGISGIVETHAGDLAGGGMDLVIIVAVNLVAQDTRTSSKLVMFSKAQVRTMRSCSQRYGRSILPLA